MNMIHSVQGKIQEKKIGYVVVDVHGLGLKVLVSSGTYDKLPEVGVETSLLTHFQVKEDSMSLYGFLHEKEIRLFEALISISGIGPKSALGILSLAPVEHLAAAITRGEKEILQKSYGIGKRTAERIVVELKDKIKVDEKEGEETLRLMESDSDVYEALISLGYSSRQAKNTIAKVDPNVKGVDARLRDALQKIKE